MRFGAITVGGVPGAPDPRADFDEMSNALEYNATGYQFGWTVFCYCRWDGTNPRSLDSDNDSMPDGWEWVYGLNPRSAADRYSDADEDGLNNSAEYALSIVTSWNMSRSWPIENATDPLNNDTDHDGMSDWQEDRKA